MWFSNHALIFLHILFFPQICCNYNILNTNFPVIIETFLLAKSVFNPQSYVYVLGLKPNSCESICSA